MYKHFKVFSVIALILFALSSCSTKQTQEVTEESIETPAGLPFESPATFNGTIPCEDCLKVDITLNVLPDTMYQLRKRYFYDDGPVKTESQIGKWLYLPEDKLLILGKQQGLLKTYVVESSNTLLFVEWEGADNASQIQYKLLRNERVDPFADIVKITGDFEVQNGAGSFTECSTGLTFPVSPVKDYPVLLQNYMNTPHERDQPLLSSVLVKIVGAEKGQSELVIEHFNRIYPDTNCEGSKNRTSLTGTFWRLQDVDDLSATKPADEKQPYILLNSDRTFRAYGSCNEMSGSYLVKGDLFLINRKPEIRLACPTGLGVENKLITAFEKTKSFRIVEDTLELLDGGGQILARFKARV